MGAKLSARSHIDEQYLKPAGQYAVRDGDLRKLKKLIIEEKLAPFYRGMDDGEQDECEGDVEECPICFLNFPVLNRSKCCGKSICTECFLQVKVSSSSRSRRNEHLSCPFCKSGHYNVLYTGKKSKEEKYAEWEEEQKVLEAQMRMREEERQRDLKRMIERESLREAQGVQSDARLVEEASAEARDSEMSEATSTDNQEQEHNAAHDPYYQSRDSFEADLYNQIFHNDNSQTDQSEGGQQNEEVQSIGVNLGHLSDFIPSQLVFANNEINMDLDELMLNQAILESIRVSEQSAEDLDAISNHSQDEETNESELEMPENTTVSHTSNISENTEEDHGNEGSDALEVDNDITRQNTTVDIDNISDRDAEASSIISNREQDTSISGGGDIGQLQTHNSSDEIVMEQLLTAMNLSSNSVHSEVSEL